MMGSCADTRRAFEAAWRLEGLPTDPAAWQPALAAELRAEAVRQYAAMAPEHRAALAAALAGAPTHAIKTAAAKAAPPAPRAPAAPKPAAPKPAAPKPALKRKLSEASTTLGPGGYAGGYAPAPGAAVPQYGMPVAMQQRQQQQVAQPDMLPYGMPAPRMPMPAQPFAAAHQPVVAARAAPPPMPPPKRGRGDGDWAQRALYALTQLMQLEASEPFHEPVRLACGADGLGRRLGLLATAAYV